MQNENKTHSTSSVSTTCQKCKQDFILDADDFSFYEKMKVPVPKICPDCRFKMRSMFRNETSLYSGRACGLCRKAIISMYNPKSPYVIYCNDCYIGDTWDPLSYAKDYDVSKSFFEQLKELLLIVPKETTFSSLSTGQNINSEYVNQAGGLKNSYLVFNSGPGEELMYSRGLRNANEIGDCYFGINLENCYECVNVSNSKNIFWGKNTFNSFNSAFVLSCRGVNDCFACVNLSNKSYHFFNEQLSQEEYKKRVNEIMGSYSKIQEIKEKFDKFSLKFPRRENNNLKTADCVGDYLFECKEVKNSFEVSSAENCKNLFSSKEIKDSVGTIGYGFKSEMLLECVATGYSANIIGSYAVESSQSILYSFGIRHCNDCIGCNGIKNASYCILNKQYTKKEYEKLREKIVNELESKDLHGLMMPQELALFAYNETIAQDNMPLSKDEAIREGFKWEDDIQKTEGRETLQPENIEDHIKDIQDSITGEVLRCANCSRNYKITKQELLFYRKMILPIPRRCFYCRHKERIIRRGSYKFWDRNCAKCQKEITTNYAP
ncbi:MAG TPA: hypothetical protein VGO21_00805, partial [Candidatus Paceibacterota bacterium]|nr:hypothetical protein [Candidatus Paceibacterota bacterium]